MIQRTRYHAADVSLLVETHDAPAAAAIEALFAGWHLTPSRVSALPPVLSPVLSPQESRPVAADPTIAVRSVAGQATRQPTRQAIGRGIGQPAGQAAEQAAERAAEQAAGSAPRQIEIPPDLQQFAIAGGGICHTDGHTSYLAIGGSTVAIDVPGRAAIDVSLDGPPPIGSTELTRIVSYALATASSCTAPRRSIPRPAAVCC